MNSITKQLLTVNTTSTSSVLIGTTMTSDNFNFSPVTSHYSPLTSHHSLLTTHDDLKPKSFSLFMNHLKTTNINYLTNSISQFLSLGLIVF